MVMAPNWPNEVKRVVRWRGNFYGHPARDRIIELGPNNGPVCYVFLNTNAELARLYEPWEVYGYVACGPLGEFTTLTVDDLKAALVAARVSGKFRTERIA